MVDTSVVGERMWTEGGLWEKISVLTLGEQLESDFEFESHLFGSQEALAAHPSMREIFTNVCWPLRFLITFICLLLLAATLCNLADLGPSLNHNDYYLGPYSAPPRTVNSRPAENNQTSDHTKLMRLFKCPFPFN